MDKKTQLLDAAERVYCEFGNLGLTVRRLASEGDTTSQTIYTYFGSRDAVIVAVYDRILADLEQLLARLGEQLQSPADDAGRQLVDTMVAYHAYCLANPARFKMLAEGLGPEGTEPAAVRSLQGQLVDLVDKAMSSVGGIGHVGSRQALALLHGLVQGQLDGFLGTEPADEATVRELVARAMGLAHTSSAA